LVDVGAVHIKGELLPKFVLNHLHVSVIAEGEMIDGMREVKLPSVAIDHVDDLAESVCGEMEVSRDLINNNCAFNQAAFLIVHGADRLGIDLINILISILKVRTIIHQIMKLNVVTKSV
jgi:hypothetical protein